ncbi:unnamed protein product [Euphydryas editha]|uniref:Cadherin domain-containing protein n=1 Tax=Euphydryas editha TaxID=104508 RepID=A0AAU9V340_EUPED|nr:unnamed protein product [Euphydryas editha]
MARIVLTGRALLYVIIFALETSALILLPHDVRPGHAIRHFISNHSRYTLLEPEYASYFTLLDDGLLMTTADLAPLLNQPLNLAVLEQTPFSSSAHTVHLLVMDRKKMLHFTEKNGINGEIPENSPPGTVVDMPTIKATALANVGPIAYKIIHGNEESIFALRDKGSTTDSDIRSVITNGDVEVIAKQSLDAERKKFYDLIVQATDLHGVNKANLAVRINVANENDHEPIFEHEIYYFAVNGTCDNDCHNGTAHWQRFSTIGKVNAFDIDGDRVYYSIKTPTNIAVIVPQTGELILAGEPDGHEVGLQILAHDTGVPPRKSLPAQVFIEFFIRERKDFPTLHREKRRVTRAVRPTKRIEFTEADGEVEGRPVFTLEKETDKETFKIRDENPWVTVEPSGVVKVKKKWDYEELGPEKTIDFWVTITNVGAGKSLSCLDPWHGTLQLMSLNLPNVNVCVFDSGTYHILASTKNK